ncbi:MAG: hypothetical protein WDO68_19895 [Gammaproteobacteria bacterium]
MKKFLIAVVAAMTSIPCGAYEIRSGLVSKIIVNAPPMSNRNVMVELEGVTQMCTISPALRGKPQSVECRLVTQDVKAIQRFDLGMI